MTKAEVEADLSRNVENYCPGFVNDFEKVKDKLL